MSLTKLADQAMMNYRFTKQQSCEDGPNDLMAIADVVFGDRRVVVGLTGGHPVDMIGPALLSLRDKESVAPTMIAVCTDMFITNGDPEVEFTGSLSKAFHAGDERVSEGLAVVAMDNDGGIETRVARYNFNDGRLSMEDTQAMDMALGRMAEAISDALADALIVWGEP